MREPGKLLHFAHTQSIRRESTAWVAVDFLASHFCAQNAQKWGTLGVSDPFAVVGTLAAQPIGPLLASPRQLDHCGAKRCAVADCSGSADSAFYVWTKGDAEGAGCGIGHSCAARGCARWGGREITAGNNRGDGQRRAGAIGERDRLGRAGGADGLSRESETGGRYNHGNLTGAGESNDLGTACA